MPRVLSPLIPGATPVVIAGQLLIPIFAPSDANLTITSMPAAADYIKGEEQFIAKHDLTLYRQARLVVRKLGTAGSSGSKMVARYTTGNPGNTYIAANWADLGTSEISVAIETTNATVNSSWIDLAAGAKADVNLTVITSGGNGSTSPIIGAVQIQVR